MDLKSKKLILFNLTMNNANQLKMKFTITKIVNLEMFSHVSITITTKYVVKFYNLSFIYVEKLRLEYYSPKTILTFLNCLLAFQIFYLC